MQLLCTVDSSKAGTSGSGVASGPGPFAVEPTFSRVLGSTVNVTRLHSNAVPNRPASSIVRARRSSGSESPTSSSFQTHREAPAEEGANGPYRSAVLQSARVRRKRAAASAAATGSLQEAFGGSSGDESAKSSFDEGSLQQQSAASARVSGWLEVEADPFSCASEVVWEDLGPSYFPRFLRSLRCTSDRCLYGLRRCRARAFTVKVLRRRSDECVPEEQRVERLVTLSELGIRSPAVSAAEAIGGNLAIAVTEVRVVWVHEWLVEERALNFCCECVNQMPLYS